MGRALPLGRAYNRTTHLFQSTPALWDGRFGQLVYFTFFNMMFQSTPALWDGRFTRLQ
ncbi:protein of unknown function [Trichlorobacter ammonificans]|uniref:Uncharacterized protein n=1 Tax=Trichlorobacter ammonificans TaxID=2916410 RepID=A0ABM9D6V7_9BACT|nr:protein of unknown function [Trichlorobacter ammonificans]